MSDKFITWLIPMLLVFLFLFIIGFLVLILIQDARAEDACINFGGRYVYSWDEQGCLKDGVVYEIVNIDTVWDMDYEIARRAVDVKN